MAWTSPIRQSTGTLISAATWNAQIADNMTFLGTNHDHNGGAGDGATLTGMPSGLILMFDSACPTGWTRVSAWDNKFVRGAAAYGGTGGAATHTHTYAVHAHGHTHAVGTLAVAGASGSVTIGGAGTAFAKAAHTHVGGALTNTDAFVNALAGTSDAASSLPAYVDVIFCKKD